MIKFSLNSTFIKPENNEIKNAVILLHGYGGDGKDISVLSNNWKRKLSNTLFVCPDGHETCNVNPIGFQWFDFSTEDKDLILKKSLEAEDKIKIYVEEIKKEFSLKSSQICLSGFSQGCMMSINVGLTSEEPYGCIVGFSGKIIDKENLSKRIKSKTKILLLHGSLDNIVTPNNFLEAKDFLIREKIPTETIMIENSDHTISTKASNIASDFIKQNLYK